MILSRSHFSKSFYYPASGTDIQPLLRFSHLVDIFVYATIGETEENVIKSIDQKVGNLTSWNGGRDLLRVKSSRYVGKDEIDACAVGHRPEYFWENEWREYQNYLLPHSRERQWAREFKIERYVGKHVRDLRLIIISGEGLATYEALSYGGEYAPKILCTIQSGVLEDRRFCLFARSIEEHKSRPQIWVRGAWSKSPGEDYDYFHPILSFDHWNTRLGADNLVMENPTGGCSRVKAYSERTRLRLNEEATIAVRGGRKVILRRKKLTPRELKNYDCAIVGERLFPRFVSKSTGGTTVLSWESLANHATDGMEMPAMTLGDALRKVQELSAARGYRRFVVTPVGFEDENTLLKDWVESGDAPISLEVRFINELEFADMLGSVNQTNADFATDVTLCRDLSI